MNLRSFFLQFDRVKHQRAERRGENYIFIVVAFCLFFLIIFIPCILLLLSRLCKGAYIVCINSNLTNSSHRGEVGLIKVHSVRLNGIYLEAVVISLVIHLSRSHVMKTINKLWPQRRLFCTSKSLKRGAGGEKRASLFEFEVHYVNMFSVSICFTSSVYSDSFHVVC